MNPWKGPFYDCFRIATCPQVLFEFHKALLKCCFWRVLSSLIALPSMKPFLMPGGCHELKCAYLRVTVGLLWVLMYKMDSFFNLSPLNTTVSIVVLWYFGHGFKGWNWLACSRNLSTSFITVPEREDILDILPPFFSLGFALLYQSCLLLFNS